MRLAGAQPDNQQNDNSVTKKTKMRAAELLREQQYAIARQTDRLFAWLMIAQWVAGIVAALWISPRAWAGTQSSTHPHVLAAIILGGLISAPPVYFAFSRPGSPLTRYIIAVSQMLTSALLIHVSGGRIETHFHVFGSLAFLAFYRDWRVFIPATIVVAADHFVRGVYFPQSVFGILAASPWRWVEHAAWVLFEDFFLIKSCLQGQREMYELATRQASLESTNESIARAVQAAEKASQAKSEFLSRTSHELRTPLNAILGFGQLLEVGGLGQEDRESVDQIMTAGRHLLRVINEVLDIAGIETGRRTLSVEPVRLTDAIGEASDLSRPLATRRNIDLQLELGSCVDYVLADRQLLLQVLLNLLSNATKYNRDGGAVIVTCEPRSTGFVRIAISDNGPGIGADAQAKLFVPFERLSAAESGIEGTGLGLAVSKNFIEAMGGSIGVETAPGAGATFWIELRSAAVPEIQAELDSCTRSAGVLDTSSVGKVLYIEDNLANLELVKRMLARFPDIELFSTTRGENGLRLARERRPDLILLDLHLPDMSGGSVLRALRADAQTREIPVVMLTADATPGQAETLLAAGARRYLTKPIEYGQLLEAVSEILPSRNSTYV
jgi:two-component system sensor histidine kinase/response regulator